MEILERQNDIGPATALSSKERSILIDLAKIGKNDVFYDLGSGHGRLVIDVVKKTKARAVGIEVDYERFCNALRLARRVLSKSELKRTDFYCADYYKFDFSDATVIYEGHEREQDEVKMFNKRLKKRARIITIDLPLVRRKPIKTASHRGLKFFVVQTPLTNSNAKTRDQWASWVLDRNARISDVYAHYDAVLKERGFTRKERAITQKELRKVVNSYF